ncbi:hypothetical protein C7A17_26540 [Ectopseudomonas mendocina]|uniref:Uncharacterized protein n=1 Tax=Ectopseudomonas mendocina TaxID=300 RepID=A0A2R3QWG0_ECTME|nr:hypothetical protein C7A17_26540 [Pseudomonas mendocina]
MHLERKVADRDGYGIWSFHQSQISWVLDQGRKTYRHARIKPAEPRPGAEVEVFIVEGADAPEETHIGPRRGVVIVL